MKRHVLVIAIAMLAAAAALAAGAEAENAPGPAAYARLKTLVGEWEADSQMGKAPRQL